MKHILNTFLIAVLTLFSSTTFASVSTATPHYKAWEKQRATIVKASVRANVPPSTMAAMAYVETRFDSGAKNKQTGVTKGLYQFDPPTWRAMLRLYGKKYGYGMNTSIYNPMANSLMAAELFKHNRKILEKSLNRKVTDSEVYMAHLLGIGGATKMLKANPNRLARDVMPKAARANKYHFYHNGGKGKPMTVAQFKAELREHVSAPKRTFGTEANAIAIMNYNYVHAA